MRTTKPSWASFLDFQKADHETLKKRPVIASDETKCRMSGTMEFDGKNYYVILPQELMDRSNIDIGDEIQISGENSGLGYVITIERAPEQEDQ